MKSTWTTFNSISLSHNSVYAWCQYKKLWNLLGNQLLSDGKPRQIARGFENTGSKFQAQSWVVLEKSFYNWYFSI